MSEEIREVEGSEQDNKYNLVTFIISLIALTLCAAPVASIAGIVLGGIGMKRCRNGVEPNKQPFIVFRRVAKPVSIVSFVVGILATIGWFIYMIVAIVIAAAAAAQ